MSFVLFINCGLKLAIQKVINMYLSQVHTDLYRTYFSEEGHKYGDLDCLSVGLRRFPLKIRYIDDLMGGQNDNRGRRGEQGPQLPRKVIGNVQKLLEMSARCNGKVTDTIPQDFVKNQYVVAEAIIRSECQTGTGGWIVYFVMGI